MLELDNIKSKELNQLKNTLFTAHNIELDETNTTFNLNQEDKEKHRIVKDITGIDYTTVPVMSKMPSYLAIKKILEHSGLVEKRQELSLIDLGCLEGGFSVEFAKYGFKKVVGIEGRKSNFEKCVALSDYFSLSNLEFRNDDVKNISNYIEKYDVALCLGLLYHLDSPFEFLEKLYNLISEKGVLFLETHYAPKNKYEHERFFLPNVYPDKNIYTMNYNNTEYNGCWWFEHSSGTPEDKKHPWSAVSNSKSFVPTLQSLMEAVYNVGFKHIYEIKHPVMHKIQENWYRILWACFKE